LHGVRSGGGPAHFPPAAAGIAAGAATAVVLCAADQRPQHGWARHPGAATSCGPGGFPGVWEFLSIGGRGSIPTLSLGGGQWLRPAPWAGYEGYAESLRRADILLCPMLSPHTSYPVLEMAACGGIVVTNTYGPKTAAALSALSPDIVGVALTLQGFVDGLVVAAARVDDVRQDRLTLPAAWDAVLAPVAQWAVAAVREAIG